MRNRKRLSPIESASRFAKKETLEQEAVIKVTEEFQKNLLNIK